MSIFSNKQTSNSSITIASSLSKFSQKELFNVIYPELYNLQLPVNEFAPVNYKYPVLYMDNYILQHFPSHSFTKNPSPDCIPKNVYESLTQNLLYPYGNPEIRKFDPNNNLPLNFDPQNEVYLTWFKLKSFNLKSNKQLSCFFVNKLDLDKNYLHDPIWFKSSTSISTMMPQPAFELFWDNYNVEFDRGIYALVFKAKRGLPDEFNEYWNTQSQDDFLNDYSYFENYGMKKYDVTLDTRYPLIKMFYSFYLMRAYVNILENPKLKADLINYSEAKYNSTLKPGSMIYINKFNFGIFTEENTIYLDNNMFMTVQPINSKSFPSELPARIHFTPALSSDASQSTSIKAELYVIPNADTSPVLRLIKNKISEQYNAFQQATAKHS